MKMTKWLSALVAAVAVLGTTEAVTHAATEDRTSRYDISAAIPDTQINKKNLTKMNLLLTPGQTENLTYYIDNNTKKDITFDISTGSATTTNLGQLDYTSINRNLDNKAPYQLGKYIKIQNSVTVKAKTTAAINATVTLPDSADYKGLLAGGVAFHEEGTAASATSQVALLARVQKDLPKYKFAVNNAKLSVKNRLITTNIENKATRRAMNAKVSTKVISEDNNKVVYKRTKTVDMAPNSSFDFRVKTKVHDLAAGDYEVKVTVKKGDVKKVVTKELRVTKSQAAELSTQQGMTMWDWIKIILLAIVLFLIAFFGIRFLVPKKKVEDD